MTYEELSYFHLATIIPAFIIGSYLLLNRKGTPRHKRLGKVYMLLMLATASIALFMPAKVGPTVFNHFGFIHLFCFSVLYGVPAAYFAVRRGNMRAHVGNMVGIYIGGIIIAGTFALMPGRFLYSVFF